MYVYSLSPRPTDMQADFDRSLQGTLKLQKHLGDYFDISAGTGPLPARSKRVGYQSGRLQNVVDVR